MRKHPISGKYRMHKGLDFAGPNGTRVSAAGPGEIIYAARKGSFGNFVEIDHGNGVVSRYAHLRKISVKKGMEVIAGQKIGEVGSTGASTGPHLHWEVRISGSAKDPQDFLDSRNNL
jgi:murein DD-endopeptidase MepM/ murein hydrolase activator NlpD